MGDRRVLQVMGRSAGGIAEHVRQLTRGLQGAGFETVVAGPAGTPGGLPDLVLDLDVPDGWLGHGPVVDSLEGLIRAENYDIVHAHGLRAGIDAARACRRTGTPSVVTIHNLVRPEVAGRIRSLFYRAAHPAVVFLADKVIAVSDEIARSLPKEIEVVYLGIDPPPPVGAAAAEVRADLGIGRDEPFVVSVARLAPQKALHVLLDALAALEVEAHLAIVGQGPDEDELRSRAARLGLSERVRFLGFRSDVASIVAAADAFCLSSAWEGIPLAAQEAIWLGVPIVATAVGGLPELVRDPTGGRLVPPANPAALAAALLEVLEDPVGAARMAAEARSRLTRLFSAEAMLARITAIYEELG